MYVPTLPHGTSSKDAAPLAWRQVPVRRAKSRAVRILWNPHFLQAALSDTSKLNLRSPNTASDNTVVLADILIMGDETVSIEAQLLMVGNKRKRYTLRMRLLIPVPPHTRARVTLRWGDQTYSTIFHDDTASIENLPRITQAQAKSDEPMPNFSLTLDFEGSTPSSR